jgi:signal transduction histidine kinase
MVKRLPDNELFNQRCLRLHKVCQELAQDINIDSLIETAVKNACLEIDASYGVFCLMNDDGSIEKVAPFGFSDSGIKKLRYMPIELGIIEALARTGETFRSSDIRQDPRLADLPKITTKIKTLLGLPISKDKKIGGYLFLAEKKNGAKFSDEDLQTMQIFAGYAYTGLENARLFKELKQRDQMLTRRNENLALLDQLAATLATSTQIDQIVEKGLTQLMEYLRLEEGEIYLRQEDCKTLKLAVHRGNASQKLWTRDQFILGEGVVGGVVKNNLPVLLNLDTEAIADLNTEIRAVGIHQVAVVPLAGRNGVMGALCVATRHLQPLDELEVQFLQAIGSWMATAVENVNLNIQGRRLAILEERERIGMDLHDGIIQSIYAVGLTLQHAHLLIGEDSEQASKRIDQAILDLDSTIRDIRAYILDLRPRQLHNEDLMAGINRLVTEFKANTLLEVDLQGPAEDLSPLPQHQAVALFHICQEALANIAKHAHAQRVEVIVWTTNDRVLLEVHDDGVGFKTDKIKVAIGHGLSNMETRVTNVGGEVEITSEPGKGTTILAWVEKPECESNIK